MKVFVGEYVCSGGLSEVPIAQLPASLLREGKAMLQAICEDASRCADVVTVLDKRIDCELSTDIHAASLRQGETAGEAWLRQSDGCDKCILIAPESEGVLLHLVSTLRRAGRSVVACSDGFIQIATDKLRTSEVLCNAGVPHPVTFPASRIVDECKLPNSKAAGPEATGWIVKPRDGCGSVGIRFTKNLAELMSWPEVQDHSQWICQPYHSGLPLSVAAIVQAGECHWLPACRQVIDSKDFGYQGGSAGLPPILNERAQAIAQRAMQAMLAACDDQAATSGWVGIDLVLGSQPDQDVIIEVNPRLTTSYIGLRHLMKNNLAARMLGIDKAPLACDRSIGEVHWESGGQVRINNEETMVWD